MNQKYYLTFDNEFIKYCELNNVDNPEKLAKEIFQNGFNIIKYGQTPKGFSIEKEVIKEVIVEKPVEVIKEIIVEKIVEVIKEVPIEVQGETQVVIKEIIKEVPVEKIIETINNEEVEKLQKENEKLKLELETLKNSIENFGRKGRFMKDSNLSSLYGE